ncbi:sugar ABC transporter substrate-binding protein [Mesorhizobium sp. WSM4303]|uniref:substrate-binding domain-containing protein n=1 Tax=unclassified Mesorhizobium TaxID=325217 RepID=UPI00115F0F32|nr:MULTISPECIES: substrate-binding domain-containing protein [unclassified Mesorhizobium]TRC98780.1 sugar ABC transporter substrate-binding protein [Mesorhizobium sp. WSM4306]TRD07171.1 sugar ABC transporter substrate-binding protein [Mesorhizobium sp. WSM4303]
MNFTKEIAAAVMAAMLASSAYAGDKDIAVIVGSAQDGFWNMVKKGVDDAKLMVEANGGTVNFMQTQNYDNFGPDLASLIEQAVAQGAKGIAIPNWLPESETPALKAARDKGVVIVPFNAGQSEMGNYGALNYFGSDEYLAGVEGGKYLASHGAKKILCHIQNPGAVNLETRCKGVQDGAKAAGADTFILRVPANLDQDMNGTSEAIKSELIADTSIDAVITLAAWAADAAANSIEQQGQGRKIQLGTFDMSASVLDRISKGTQTFAIDQQPYLQGFLATSMLFANLKFGTAIATKPVLTGPAIVDASNVASAIEGVKLGAR